jgi:D-arabinose 1-dehydrogenase-like Zn-dependent alcohol dehydrogenase
MARMKVAQIPKAGADFEIVERENGRMMVVGASLDPVEVTPVQLIFGRRSIQGWSSGIPTDSEDTLRFAELTGVRLMIEKYSLTRVTEAYARMMSRKAQFRVVLTM